MKILYYIAGAAVSVWLVVENRFLDLGVVAFVIISINRIIKVHLEKLSVQIRLDSISQLGNNLAIAKKLGLTTDEMFEALHVVMNRSQELSGFDYIRELERFSGLKYTPDELGPLGEYLDKKR